MIEGVRSGTIAAAAEAVSLPNFRSCREPRFMAWVHRTDMHALHNIVDLLLEHRKQMQHPDPEMAPFFAVLMLNDAVTELFLSELNGSGDVAYCLWTGG